MMWTVIDINTIKSIVYIGSFKKRLITIYYEGHSLLKTVRKN